MFHPAFPRLRDEHTRYVLLPVLAGFVGAVVGLAVQQALLLLSRAYPGEADNVVEVARALPVAGLLLVPLAGGVLAGLLKSAARRFSDESAGAVEVMEIVSLSRRKVPLSGTVLKTLSSILSIGTGASVGREGPMASLTTALAAFLGNRARLSDEHFKILCASGLAAGFAAAYNTPFAATLFILEIVVGNFNMRFFGPVVVASLAAVLPGRLLLRQAPVYGTGHYLYQSPWEVLFYAAVAILCGLLAVVFLRAMRAARGFFTGLMLPPPVALALTGLLVGAIALRYPEVWGNGYSVVNEILDSPAAPSFLALLALAKLAATLLSAGSGTCGGIFTPTLLIGAAAGASLGAWADLLWPELVAPTGTYALLGMAALLAGTLRAPLLAIVMVFEFTGDYTLLLPLMLVSTASFYIASRFESTSMYTEDLERKGLIWKGSPEERVLRGLKVQDILRSGEPLIPESTPVEMVLEVLLSSRANLLFVSDSRGRLAGMIDIHDVKDLFREEEGRRLVARDLIRPVQALTPRMLLADAIPLMWDLEPGVLPVVESTDGRKFLGIVTRRDILAAIDREVLRRNVMLGRFRYDAGEGEEERTDFFELPPAQEMNLVEVPRAFAGKTIGELGVAGRWGLNVLALTRQRKDGTKLRVLVGARTRLEDGDHLTLVGPREAIDAFRRGEDIRGGSRGLGEESPPSRPPGIG